MAPSLALLGVPSRSSSLVDETLLGGLEADQLGADGRRARRPRPCRRPAQVALAAVAQLDRLERTRGRAGRDRRAADGAVVEGDLDLDGGVASGVEDLAGADGFDGGHGGS